VAIVEVSIIPLGTGSTSISRYVADCHKILEQEENISYRLTPMGTILEGELDVILNAARRMHELPFEKGALRVCTHIVIDDRRDKKASMEQKISSVEEKL